MSDEPVDRNTALERGRQAFARKAWREAHDQLAAADHDEPLVPSDLELLAMSGHLLGRDAEGLDTLARAHQAYLGAGDPESAARCAFWVGFMLFTSGERAKGSGWLARARRVLEDHHLDSVVQGYLHLPEGIRLGQAGNGQAALETFGMAVETGRRFGDRELQHIARQGQARALIKLGQVREGLALLDEIMVAATAGEVSPPSVGPMYCSMLEACHEVYDLRRAQEWTEALSGWYASQPDLVPYRGQCLVHRAEMLQMHGAWSEAMHEALRACEYLSNPPQPAVGEAHYQRAEVHRLRGELAEAEAAYRQASEAGKPPQPGLALLRLAQRQSEAAAISIRRALDEARARRAHSRLLGAYVEIMLATGDRAAARAGADELSDVAERFDAPYLRALAAHSAGALHVAEERHEEALGALREACVVWRELAAPYESARTHELLSFAHRALGDEDSARLELDVARRTFRDLGALPDMERIESLASPRAPAPASNLTSREVEVLQLIATGKTNRAIAQSLRISEKTVARHVSNIFTKLGLSSRAAATAFAYQQGLVRQPAT